MKVLVAIDSFKEAFSAVDGCKYISEGLQAGLNDAQIFQVPMADGGEGTCEVLASSCNAKKIECNAYNALREEVNTHYYINEEEQVAIIESAAICGLEMIPVEKRNPLISTSYGLGQLILDAIHRGAKKIIIGLGGSATNDAGVGMLHAMGAKFYQNEEELNIVEVMDLQHITKIDIDDIDVLLKDVELVIASDVENPFVGPMGATRIFGSQKGASEEDIEVLEKQLVAFCELVLHTFGIDLNGIKGSGAAGGLGGALLLIHGDMQKGIDLVIKETKLEEYIKQSDVVISGEGSIDAQSANGKTISGIAKLCKKHNTLFICIGGRVIDDLTPLYELGVDAVFSIAQAPKSLPQALIDAPRCVEEVAYNIARLLEVMPYKMK